MKKFSKCVGKMRVSLMTLAVVFCCAMAASMFSACSSSSDDDNNKEQDSGKATSVKVAVDFLQTEDILKYCDVSVEYTGATEPEKVTETKWLKSLVAKLPATLTFKRTVTLKAGVDLSAITSIKVSNTYFDGYCLLNASNNPISESPMTEHVTDGIMSGDEFADNLEKGAFNNTLTFSFDANGNRTK